MTELKVEYFLKYLAKNPAIILLRSLSLNKNPCWDKVPWEQRGKKIRNGIIITATTPTKVSFTCHNEHVCLDGFSSLIRIVFRISITILCPHTY